MKEFICLLLETFGIPVSVSLIAILAWEGLKRLIKWWEYRREYSSFEGFYIVKNKYDQSEPMFYYEVGRKGKTFIIKDGVSYDEKVELIHAEITMSDESPEYGRGYFRHNEITDGKSKGVIGFGFWEIQLDKDKDEILCHTTIYDDKKKKIQQEELKNLKEKTTQEHAPYTCILKSNPTLLGCRNSQNCDPYIWKKEGKKGKNWEYYQKRQKEMRGKKTSANE